jgi:hypothetical protein
MLVEVQGVAMHNSHDQVYLTRNSEYHLRRHVCVRVRDRRSGLWLDDHPALTHPLAASVCTAGERSLVRAPLLGEALEFDVNGEPLRTTPILAIERRRRAAAFTAREAAAAQSATSW